MCTGLPLEFVLHLSHHSTASFRDRLLGDSMMQELKIHLFGGVEIVLNDVPLGSFLSTKAPALRAYLAVTGRPHRREALAGLLWGDLPEAAATNNLRQVLTNLRENLRQRP